MPIVPWGCVYRSEIERMAQPFVNSCRRSESIETPDENTFNGCLVIPVMDESGIITEIYGCKLSDKNANKGLPSHLYLPGPHKGIWNPVCLNSKEIILCEALIDALTFWVNGFRNVTASYGMAGFTPDHLAAFIDHRIEKVYIAYDRDEAGNKAADKLAAQLIIEGIQCYRINFPHGMDANSYAKQISPPAKALETLLRSAAFMDDESKTKPPETPVPVVPPDHSATPEQSRKEVAKKEKINIPVEQNGENPLRDGVFMIASNFKEMKA